MTTVKDAINKAKEIVSGHWYEAIGANDELSQSRLDICMHCPIFIPESPWGPICDSKKFINEDGTEASEGWKKGFVKGCGCRLKAKTKNEKSHCIINKW